MARSSEREEGRAFKYQRRTAEDVRARANMRGGSFDSIVKAKYKVLKVRDGKNLIRIMPPTWEPTKHYGYDLWVNYGIGVDNQSYLSLSKMKGEPDPIAEARREAERNGDKELAKALAPRQRIAMWVIDRNDEDEGPQIFLCPFSLDKSIAALSHDEDTKETVFVEDNKTGCDIRFYKEGSGKKTDYPAEKIRIMKPSPLSQDNGQAREWLEFIQDNPLPDCVQFYDYDHIATTFDGQARVERSDDDEEDRPRSRAKGNGRNDEEDEKPARSRAAIDDEDDERRPQARRRPARFDETDDDDEAQPRARKAADEDDDDPEIKPRRSKTYVQSGSDDEEDQPKRARLVDNEVEDRDVKPRGSIRDRLSRGRKRPDDDDEAD